MKKLNRNVLALLASLAIGFTSFSFVACSDNNDDGNDKTDVTQDSDKTTETQPAKNPEATTETYKGAFVVGKDSYTTLNIMSDKTYEMTDSLVEGTTNDWGTWELLDEIPPAQIYSRASALAKTNKQYKFTSKAHKTSDGKSGTILVETSPAGAAISEDTDATTKIEVSGAGLDPAEKIYKTTSPVFIEKSTLNLTETEKNELLIFEAIEKKSEKKGVKITFKKPASLGTIENSNLQVTYLDKKGSSSTMGQYFVNENGNTTVLTYPYVDEDSLISFRILLECPRGNSPQPEQFIARYILNTKSGAGAISDLPENYSNWSPCSDKRVVIKDGKMTVTDVQASKVLPKNVKFSSLVTSAAICYTKSNESEKRWVDAFWCNGTWPSVEKPSDTCTFDSFPKPNKKAAEGYPYYFYEVRYQYTIEGDDFTYHTPSINSAIFEVPENSFLGQTFTEPNYGYSDEYSKTWKFDKDTVKITSVNSRDSSNVQTVVETYNYVPDEENSLLTLKLKGRSFKDSSQDISYANLEEAKDLLKKTYTGDKLAFEEECLTAEFNTPLVLKYRTYESYGTKGPEDSDYVWHHGNFIETYRYFDGTLPTTEEFHEYDGISPVLYEAGVLVIRSSDDSSLSTEYESIPTFKDGKFSGNLYSRSYTADDKKIITKVGTIEGTYTVAKKTSDGDYRTDMMGGSWEITFTFTKLPETVTYIKTNTLYTIGRGK